MDLRQTRSAGIQALGLATELLHRVRLADPDAGVWEAADLQWWWRTPRRSDELEQLFWLDGDEPVAAVLLTEWKHAWGLDPIVMPGTPAAIRDRVWAASVARIDELSLSQIETAVRDDDEALAQF